VQLLQLPHCQFEEQQAWDSAGLLVAISQLLESLQILICCEFVQVFQLLHCQLGTQIGAGVDIGVEIMVETEVWLGVEVGIGAVFGVGVGRIVRFSTPFLAFSTSTIGAIEGNVDAVCDLLAIVLKTL
jgi:hypothetical protein